MFYSILLSLIINVLAHLTVKLRKNNNRKETGWHNKLRFKGYITL